MCAVLYSLIASRCNEGESFLVIKDNMESLQHDKILTWIPYEPLIYVYPVINEAVVPIKIVEKNEML